MQIAKAQARLHIYAVLAEPLLFAHTTKEPERASDKETEVWPRWKAVHVRLKGLTTHSLGPFYHEMAQILMDQVF